MTPAAAKPKPYLTAENERHLLQALCAVEQPAEMKKVLSDILTAPEYQAVLKRWTILRLLRDGLSQRKIAEQIDGSLCNVTRGAKIVRTRQCTSIKLMDRLAPPDSTRP